MASKFLVVDVQLVVDKILLMLGKPRREKFETDSVWDSFGTTISLRGESVMLRPVWSNHIVSTTQKVLEEHYGVSRATSAKCILALADLFADCNGYFDNTQEDYKALSAKSFLRYGTDTEDEAILACAERLVERLGTGRDAVALVSRDRDLRDYFTDRNFVAYNAADFCTSYPTR